MAKDGVQIQLDQASKQNLDKQFQALGTTISEAGPKAIFKVLMKIKTTAQNRLLGRGHIITSRLRNSIYVQMNDVPSTPDNQRNYTDKDGKSYDAELKTVKLKTKNEGAVGTNVLYGKYVEFRDSYLYWALKNVDVSQSVGEDLKDAISKKGKFSAD